MMTKLIIWISIFFISQIALCQSKFELIKSIQIQNTEHASLDKQENIYLVDSRGNIDKYDATGELLIHYSTGRSEALTLIEARNPLKIFTFYRDFQEYQFYDRFVLPSETYSLSEISGFTGMATLSGDNNIWLVDYTSFSLNKYDVTFQQNIIERPLDLLLDPSNYDISYMVEYQNLLFMADGISGILVFDNLGNYLRTITTDHSINYFNCLHDFIYYVEGSELIKQNIYNNDREILNLPQKADLALLTSNQLFLISENSLNLYKY